MPSPESCGPSANTGARPGGRRSWVVRSFNRLRGRWSDGGRRVELVRQIPAAARAGPINGMYALQRVLRKHVEAGRAPWLTLVDQPTDRRALPWFWYSLDRGRAVQWDRSGRPWVNGPNMMFMNSFTPRSEPLECQVLDAQRCRLIFCHADWYRRLILQQRGPSNRAAIVLWMYPIEPWPEGPAPDEHDLLIHNKNGNFPGLIEHLQRRYPRHVLVTYGKFERTELYQAARRSRACVYLADDESGGLVLEEMLLSGCPVVGIERGSPLIRDGVTGVRIDRLPPGEGHASDPTDRAALERLERAIVRAQAMDRSSVRAAAAEEFDPDRIAGIVLESLDRARQN